MAGLAIGLGLANIIGPLLPGIITTVETVIKAPGAQKLQVGVALLANILKGMVNVPGTTLPSAEVLDPNLTKTLQDMLQKQFDLMASKLPNGTTVPVITSTGGSNTSQIVTVMVGKVTMTFPVCG